MSALDVRLAQPTWAASPPTGRQTRNLRVLLAINVALSVWYFSWLLQPERVGNPVLYGVLVIAEVFNLIQAAGFWWTISKDRPQAPPRRWEGPVPAVDVFIPTYSEPIDIVEPTVAAALALRGAKVRVALLDDGVRPEMEALAARYGIAYIIRDEHEGAKAGNINNALGLTSAPFVAVFDCDHVPDVRFMEETLGAFADPEMAFVQTPQYYGNLDSTISAGAWGQQALFFGPIARGKDAMGAMFCCGTNVVFRREALEGVGGFPTNSLTEDYELSIHLHEQGWKSRYVPEVLARGLGPEDMASYVSQQQRWARGCLSGLPRVLRSRLPWKLRLQYLLSGLYFLSGWTFIVYLSLPLLRLGTGVSALAPVGADSFLLHFAPYFGASILSVAVASRGAYTFGAFTLAAANFGVHVRSALLVLLRRKGSFVVTPKHGVGGRQLKAVRPTIVALAALATALVLGLAQDSSPGNINNMAYAGIHLVVLVCGAWPALTGRWSAAPAPVAEVQAERRRSVVDLTEATFDVTEPAGLGHHWHQVDEREPAEVGR